MVAGRRRIVCFVCSKKCSGNVLRYQDRYYHKHCFESELNSENHHHQDQDLDSLANQANQTFNPPSDDANRDQPIAFDINSNSEIMNRHKSPSQSSKSLVQAEQKRQLIQDRQQQQYQYHLQENSRASSNETTYKHNMPNHNLTNYQTRGHTIDNRLPPVAPNSTSGGRNSFRNSSSATTSQTKLTQSKSMSNGLAATRLSACAGCGELIKDGDALIALDSHWHVWCFRCSQCKGPLHGEYVAKDGKAYCEKDYQKLYGIVCIYCKRYITGKVLQAGESYHFHPSCARCSKCGDPFVPGEEMYLQGEVTWHPRCGPGPEAPLGLGQPLNGWDDHEHEDSQVSKSQNQNVNHRTRSPSLSSRSRSASPFSNMSRQYGRTSPFVDSEQVGDLSRIYTISYLDADPTQSYLRRPIEPKAPKSPQFSRPSSINRDYHQSRSSSRSHCNLSSTTSAYRDRSVPRGMYSVLSSSSRPRSPSMMNEEAIQNAHYPSGRKPSADHVPNIERDDFPAPPFAYSRSQLSSRSRADDYQEQRRSSRPRSRETTASPATMISTTTTARPAEGHTNGLDDILRDDDHRDDDDDDQDDANRVRGREEEELSKIASGIGKIFLQTVRERERLRAWKRSNLDPRNASRTPSATREPNSRMRYDNPSAASPSRDLDRPRVWQDDDGQYDAGSNSYLHSDPRASPTRTRSSLGKSSSSQLHNHNQNLSYNYKVVQSNRSTLKPGYGVAAASKPSSANQSLASGHKPMQSELASNGQPRRGILTSANSSLRRSMPNVNMNQINSPAGPTPIDGPPKLYPYHLLATSNYRLPPDVDRCHLERHLSNEEFHCVFNCDRLDFYRMPEWKRNEMKRRARLF